MIHRIQKGFTLIEVLVALLILSIGLVGMAALYMNSIRNIHSSYYHSLASTVALDLEERMWEWVATNLTEAGQCLDGDDLAIIQTELQERWRITPPSNRAGIPNLTVTFSLASDGGAPTTVLPGRNQWNVSAPGTWTESWIQVPVTLTWGENRFDSESSVERFDYIARAPCVSLFTHP